MGCFGNCLGDCDDCSACTEASGFTNWAILTELNGFSLAGTFGDLTANCRKFGNGCDREDETVYDEYEELTDFNPDLNSSLNLWSSTGCSCGQATSTGERYQTRRADRWSFWLSKLITVEVQIQYLTPTTFKLIASVGGVMRGSVTTSSLLQRRRFDWIFDCSTFGNTYGTPTDPGPLEAPDPKPPCVPLLAGIEDLLENCPAPEGTESASDPCIEEPEIYVKDFTVLDPSTYPCNLQDRQATLVMRRVENCCQDFCRQAEQPTNRIYESAEIECDDIPSTIDLTTAFPGTNRAAWRDCGFGFPPSFYPADLTYNFPSTIQIQLS
jgi:hypothetical protein